MTIAFHPMTEEEFDRYMAYLIPDYAKDLSDNFIIPLDLAMMESKDLISKLLPNKHHTDEHFVCHIVSIEDKQSVGAIWYNIQFSTNKAYIYHVLIKEEFRKKGFASAALQTLERTVKSRGVTSLGLNVFGSNPHAYKLYEKLGYHVQSTSMGKRI